MLLLPSSWHTALPISQTLSQISALLALARVTEFEGWLELSLDNARWFAWHASRFLPSWTQNSVRQRMSACAARCQMSGCNEDPGSKLRGVAIQCCSRGQLCHQRCSPIKIPQASSQESRLEAPVGRLATVTHKLHCPGQPLTMWTPNCHINEWCLSRLRLVVKAGQL